MQTIYRNAIGGLEPLASLHGTRARTEKCWNSAGEQTRVIPEKWTLASVCGDINGQSWPSLPEAEAALLAEGWEITQRKMDGHGIPRLHLRHKATHELAEQLRAGDEAKWRDAVPCFVRFGKPPANGRSRNWADNTLEPGVSVFRGQMLPTGEARPLPETNQELGSMLHLSTLQLYIVAGEEIGVGSDGEPLLANCRIISAAK